MGLVGILKDICNGYVIFAIIIITMVGVAGVLRKGLVTGILYSFDIDNGGICYRNFTLF